VPAKITRQMSNIKLLFIVALLAVCSFCYSSSSAVQIAVHPTDLFPGDAFVIKILDMETPSKTTACIDEKRIPLGPCGNDCLLGVGVVDPDAQPGEKIVIVNTEREQMLTRISVKKAEYPEHHLKLPKKQVELGPKDLARVNREADRLKKIWTARTERLFESSFAMPLPNPVITVYGARRIMNDRIISIHGGVDIRGRLGEEIKASNRGRVALVDNLFYGGNTVVIDHGLGIFTVYMHLDRSAVNSGDLVSKGDLIGLVGSSGRSTGPHLHFGAKILSSNANPVSLINLPIE